MHQQHRALIGPPPFGAIVVEREEISPLLRRYAVSFDEVKLRAVRRMLPGQLNYYRLEAGRFEDFVSYGLKSFAHEGVT